MDEKGSLEGYLTLHARQRDSFDNRRSYEWKINFALWGGIALTTHAFFKFVPPLDAANITWVYGFLFTLYVLWSIGLWNANRVDKRWGRYYREHAEKILNKDDGKQPKRPGHSFTLCGLWAPVLQIAATGGFLLASRYLLHYRYASQAVSQ